VVAQPAGERRCQHVGDKERHGERANLGVARVKLALDEGDFAGKNIAVDVVGQVEGDEQHERDESGADAGGGWGRRGRQGVGARGRRREIPRISQRGGKAEVGR